MIGRELFDSISAFGYLVSLGHGECGVAADYGAQVSRGRRRQMVGSLLAVFRVEFRHFGVGLGNVLQGNNNDAKHKALDTSSSSESNWQSLIHHNPVIEHEAEMNQKRRMEGRKEDESTTVFLLIVQITLSSCRITTSGWRGSKVMWRTVDDRLIH